MFRLCLGFTGYSVFGTEGGLMMTAPIVLAAVVGGSVSFLVAVFVNFYRDVRSRKQSVAESNRIWE
jgi:hypothetical protein